MAHPLILASSSQYRRALLNQLGLTFESASPHINEAALEGEPARDLAARLARQKALALAERFPQGIIIGSDQVAECGGRTLGKPGSPERAVEQLMACSGKRVHFHTGVSVLDATSGRQLAEVEQFDVVFRSLREDQIRYYVEQENPVDCAGSFKVEGLGIALFEKMEGTDYNSLIGLPLIRLISMLRQFDIDVLGPAATD
ncbi:Maf family protein [Microbulbifer yueqingensis]|uniref:7-methyl-GTP pyrophosphatase n=1 Tax=Microbulbifer yueqingensis TaxID=658219 RepID=A0A1G8ZKD3_9GAMM|nr:Maf family protein [Microbulbifer yueqingensis]SDK15536.1 septum formation protein [Microbulbifer yueqingensis]